MILGNHDLETNLEDNSELKIKEEEKEEVEKDCFILTQERKNINEINPKINFVLWDSKIVENTLILMIDTSMYIDNEEEYLSCYKKMPEVQYEESIDTIRKKQNDFIKQKINQTQNIKNIIFVGHHPIVFVKNKKNENKITSDIYKNFIDVLKYNTEIKKKYYYLCADLHLYQKGTIKLGNIEIDRRY